VDNLNSILTHGMLAYIKSLLIFL